MTYPVIKWWLCLSSSKIDIPFQEIEDKLGERSTHRWKIEDCRDEVPVEFRASGWQYEVVVEGCRSVQDAFDKIESFFYPHVSTLQGLVNEYSLDVAFTCIIYASREDSPYIGLSPESIDFIHSLHSELKFDLYFWEDDKEDEEM